MDTLLENGQHKTAINGLPIAITGTEEIIQRALIRLGVRKGSIPVDPKLGSQFYRLQNSDSDSVNRMALSYAGEALKAMPEVRVISAKCKFVSGDTVIIEITITINGETHLLEVNNNRYL